MFNYIRICKFSNLKRFYSDIASSKNILEPLLSRSLIRVNGPEVWGYLQGLITNDMSHLSKKDMGTMYTMFLNTKGRIFCDAIIYKFEDSDTYFIECDREVLEPLQKHLKQYRVRRKIEVHNLSNEYKLYSLFNASIFRAETPDEHKIQWERILTLDPNVATNMHKDLRIFKDPRVKELGFRVIANTHINVKDEIDDLIKVTDAFEPNECYASLRYSLGVGEGLNEHPIGTSFPLECNCDYLHGVSFHKGCYIGQELTARIHHTGVVRKRLMPLSFSKIPTLLPTENNIIHHKINLGKLRGIKGNVGLALLRVNEALEFQEITIGDGVAVVKKPSWWPIEVSKVKVSAHKNV